MRRVVLFLVFILFLSSCSGPRRARTYMRWATKADPTLLQPIPPHRISVESDSINFSFSLKRCIDWPNDSIVRLDSNTGTKVILYQMPVDGTATAQGDTTPRIGVSVSVPPQEKIVDCPPCPPQVVLPPIPKWQLWLNRVCYVIAALSVGRVVLDRVVFRN